MGAPLLTSGAPTIQPSGRVGSPGTVLTAGSGALIIDPSAFLTLLNFPSRNRLCGGQVEIGFGPTLPLAIQATSPPRNRPPNPWKMFSPIRRRCGLFPSFG